MDEREDAVGHLVARLDNVGAVVVHYHREREAAELLANLVDRQGLLAANVVVVDNGSSAGELDSEIRATGHEPRVLTLPNVGFAAAVNAGRAELPRTVQHVVILSHEVVLGPQCLAELVMQLQKTPRALVGPILTLDGSTVWSAGGLLSPVRSLPYHTLRGKSVNEVPDGVRSCTWLDGAVIATTRSMLEELGGLDEDYFLYTEDVDLGLRAHRAFADVLVVPKARAQQSPSPNIEPYIWTRNMFLLFRKHRRWLPWFLWLASCGVGMLRDVAMSTGCKTLRRRTRAVVDGLRGRAGPPPLG